MSQRHMPAVTGYQHIYKREQKWHRQNINHKLWILFVCLSKKCPTELQRARFDLSAPKTTHTCQLETETTNWQWSPPSSINISMVFCSFWTEEEGEYSPHYKRSIPWIVLSNHLFSSKYPALSVNFTIWEKLTRQPPSSSITPQPIDRFEQKKNVSTRRIKNAQHREWFCLIFCFQQHIHHCLSIEKTNLATVITKDISTISYSYWTEEECEYSPHYKRSIPWIVSSNLLFSSTYPPLSWNSEKNFVILHHYQYLYNFLPLLSRRRRRVPAAL